ncbi:helix-turn-helix domain-containing protein [Paracoccus sp. S-4012]|uniref:IclR family transcriptional regulator n=1 Tax=Paracoccus sp. S-4012 TaxID=2665648 RepID=UPI0012B05DD6|nr:IclR family transcriptional regulator [Paracoccus sp. S-4012]MRX51807.1 helix-turn-helix domain-containing protein [Paracoccus sp. S-4012]
MRKRAKNLDGNGGADSAATSTSLTRGLDILRAFSQQDATLGNLELLERTGLPKATVSRLTAALVAQGYLNYDDLLGRYSIGPATVSLGYSALSSSPVVQMAVPLMQELADETGVAVSLGMRDELEMVYLANCRSMSPVTLRLNVGSRLPVWRTAMGLAYLAGMKPEPRKSLVAELMRREPAQAERIRALAEDAVESLRTRGFVTSLGTWYSYINAVGVAFRPTDGTRLVALTCGGIVDLVPAENCTDIAGPALVRMVERLRDRLEGRESTATRPPARPQGWKTTAD